MRELRRGLTLALTPVVDRIGGGDAYAAGVIYGIAKHLERARIVEFAVTLAALKHGMPGDFIVTRADEVWSAIEPGSGTCAADPHLSHW